MDAPESSNPPPEAPPAGEVLTPVEAGCLLELGAEALETRPLTGPRRGWEPPSVAAVQALLPQVEVTQFLARGGMGAVYRGFQRSLRREVAVKILPPELAQGGEDLQFAERFRQEAQAMARLSHPNIVAVFDAGEVRLPEVAAGGLGDGETGRPGEGETGSGGDGEAGKAPAGPEATLLYFVMEFVEGTDLAQVLAREGRMAPGRAVPILTAVCEALAFAHEEGIVHRDIKPSNVMLDRRGRVKVADFGLAKALNLETTVMTRSDVTLGTADFVAPEVLVPRAVVDARADLYAVGVMLYQMLTGRLPRGRFDPPGTLVPGLGRAFDAIVDRAMQADPAKRQASALELKRELEAALRALPAGAAVLAVRPERAGTAPLELLGREGGSLLARELDAAAESSARLWHAALVLVAAVLFVLSGVAFFLPTEVLDSPEPARAPERLRPRWVRGLEEAVLPPVANARLAAEGLWLAERSHLLVPAPLGPVHQGGVRLRLNHAAGAGGPWLRARSTAARCYTLAADPGGGLLRLGLWNEEGKMLKELRAFPLPQALAAGQDYELELVVVGRTLSVRLNRRELGRVEDGSLVGGAFGVGNPGGGPALIKALDFLNLDGMTEPEARSLAGLAAEGG